MNFKIILNPFTKFLKPLVLCLGLCFLVGLFVFSYTATATAQITMSNDAKAMQAKSVKLNAKAQTRTTAAIERMKRILREKRQGKRGFTQDFNTVPGGN